MKAKEPVGHRKTKWLKGMLVAMGAFVSVNAHGLGPLDGELGLSWWGNQFEEDVDEGTLDAGSLNGFAEIWWDQKWGIRGARHESALEDVGIDSSDHFSIDLKRRFFSLTDNSFLALGAGWESIDLDDGGNSSGPRLTAEGRIGLGGVVYLYGQTSWLPELDDVGARSNLEGQEFEAGLTFDPAPFVSVRFGFRRFKLDFDQGGSSNSSESDGFILGAGFHW
jgi:hypothetical protein